MSDKEQVITAGNKVIREYDSNPFHPNARVTEYTRLRMNKAGTEIYGQDTWNRMRTKWLNKLGVPDTRMLREFEAEKTLTWLLKRASEKGTS